MDSDGSSAKGLRRRNVKLKSDSNVSEGVENNPETENQMKKKIKLSVGTFWLTRIVLLRYIAFIYCVAFLVAYHQNEALIGTDGLLPANLHLDNIQNHVGNDSWNKLQHAPTIIWFFDYNTHLDRLLNGIACLGLALSAFVLISGSANIPLMLIIWALYHSVVNVGQRWYSFGWESQLLETGFLAAFLCPLFSLKQLPSGCPTSFVVLLGFRWLIFRIMLGAGLIKIRGDQCWRDLTCMNYHYETQPVPNPISYFMHQEPELFHKLETLVNHIVELPAPFLLLLTRRLCMAGGIIQILFQVILIISGNLSFLNWLTIAPSLACFDDASLSWMFSARTKSKVLEIQESQKSNGKNLKWGNYVRKIFNISLGVLVAYLSIPIVQNLMSSRQVMNTSFDSLRLVNTYGAFGSVTKERTEVIFQGTHSSDPNGPSTEWLEYEFKCKPGNISRRPCIISPYHYRLDWLMWFAAFQNYQHNNWLVHVGIKFLANDAKMTSLIAHNPFEGQSPPKWVRAEHYRYVYTKFGSKWAGNGAWWRRKHVGSYLQPISLSSVRDYAKAMRWTIPSVDQEPK